jgi:hypothetical protein
MKIGSPPRQKAGVRVIYFLNILAEARVIFILLANGAASFLENGTGGPSKANF